MLMKRRRTTSSESISFIKSKVPVINDGAPDVVKELGRYIRRQLAEEDVAGGGGALKAHFSPLFLEFTSEPERNYPSCKNRELYRRTIARITGNIYRYMRGKKFLINIENTDGALSEDCHDNVIVRHCTWTRSLPNHCTRCPTELDSF